MVGVGKDPDGGRYRTSGNECVFCGPAEWHCPQSSFPVAKAGQRRGVSALKADESVVGTSEAKQLKNRMRELERILGQKTMEMEILQEALEVAHEKNGLRGSHPCPKTIPGEDGMPRPENCPVESSPSTSIE